MLVVLTLMIFISMRMGMPIVMRMSILPSLPIFLPRQILLPIHPNIHLGSRNPAPHHARDFQARSQTKSHHGLLQESR